MLQLCTVLILSTASAAESSHIEIEQALSTIFLEQNAKIVIPDETKNISLLESQYCSIRKGGGNAFVVVVYTV